MQTNNNKLKERAIRIISEIFSVSENQAMGLLEKHGSIRNVMENSQIK